MSLTPTGKVTVGHTSHWPCDASCRLKWSIHLRVQGLIMKYEHPTYTPQFYGTFYLHQKHLACNKPLTTQEFFFSSISSLKPGSNPKRWPVKQKLSVFFQFHSQNSLFTLLRFFTLPVVRHSGRTSVSGRRTFLLRRTQPAADG